MGRDELAKLPTYYIMDLALGMAETVAPHMPSAAAIAACQWLPDPELKVYSDEYARTGFQGGLNWYRCMTGPEVHRRAAALFRPHDRRPSAFIAGKSDWGIYQMPGAIERMQSSACTRMRACELIEGAGHWVQQEQPERVAEHLLKFLSG
jgi:pimeloyl-ACP methyl ester carboxylesterase